ncbi:cupin domain-containing protein [Natrialbaceae archaeon AArc-T1-2]|uniref:cupin domain-containing protein n=1 Tax=Natrialbaceae archaeon AArc-T1-2 TaxID=3053904 RepID=UPI00255AB226|nr:cupin domain-containing protein [Natrialbaceae archaeon AArc-T1-2]WIV66551.1 cupin domain-containing protein [Natrialbaceae archaeon AArc-T1-2]
MYTKVSLENAEAREFEDGPTLRSIGYDLQAERMRPAVWEYEAGEENAYHRQDEQEELYVVLEGRFDVTIERDDDRSVVELGRDDCLLVPPEPWRQLAAREDGTVLVVGAPNVKDDGILEE